MKWLVWKEYRLNRLILVVGVALLVVPHSLALILAWFEAGPPLNAGVSQVRNNILISSVYSLVLSQLTLALLGGNAIACERVDRSAEFLAYLPVSRTRILAGKITLVLFAAAMIWGLNLLVQLSVAADLLPLGSQDWEMVRSLVACVAITGFMFVSVGWLLSSVLESPTFAICGGLITPMVVILGIQSLGWLLGYTPDETAWSWYWRTCLVLAPTCFLAGTCYYLRRVEP